MGILYNSIGKKKSKGNEDFDYTSGKQGYIEEAEALRKKAIESGFDETQIPELNKDKPGLLDRLFGLLSAGETAPAVKKFLETRSLSEAGKEYGRTASKRLTLQGYRDDPTYEDIIEDATGYDNWGTKIAGIAGDVLLDPTTYIPVVGAAAKGAKAVGKGLKPVSKLAMKSGKVRKVAEGVQAFGDLFNPYGKLERALPEEMAAKFVTGKEAFLKGSRYARSKQVEGALDLAKKAVKETGDVNAGKTLSKFIESGKQGEIATPLKSIADDVEGMFKKMFDKETSNKLIKSGIDNYVPHMYTDEALEYVSKTGGEDVAGILNKTLKSSKQRKIVGQIDEINDAFRKATGNEFDLFERDVFKLMAKRGVSSERAIAVTRYISSTTNEFGITPQKMRELNPAMAKLDDALGATPLRETAMVDGLRYKLYKPDGNLRFFPAEITNEAGDVKNFVGVGKAKEVYLPEVIVDDLNKTISTFTKDEDINKILKGFDAVQGIWKKNVTGIFPAFHIRNFIGGYFNNYLAGVLDPTRYLDAIKMMKGSDDIVANVGGRDITYKQLYELLKQRGVIDKGQGAYDVFEQIGKGELDEISKVTKKVNPAKKVGQFLYNTYPEKATQGIEGVLRGSLAIDVLKKGGTLDEAVSKVFRYHFDYAPEGLSTLERTYLKRLIPFYNWTKKNAILQMEEMVTNPRYAPIVKGYRDIGAEKGEAGSLPDYMSEGTVSVVGRRQDENKDPLLDVLYGLGLPPEALNQLDPQGIASQVTPALKAPAELLTGHSFFYKKPLEDTMGNAPTLIKKAPKVIQDAVGYTEIERDGRTISKVDPVKFYLLTQLAGRYFYTAENALKPETTNALKVLTLMTGIKGKTINMNQQDFYKEKDKYTELADFLYDKGVARRFTKTYIPEEEK